MKNTLYGIGLDIGVASVGWAVVGLNGTANLLDCSVWV